MTKNVEKITDFYSNEEKFYSTVTLMYSVKKTPFTFTMMLLARGFLKICRQYCWLKARSFLQQHKIFLLITFFGVPFKNWDSGVKPTLSICLQLVEPAQTTIATKFILACAVYISIIQIRKKSYDHATSFE